GALVSGWTTWSFLLLRRRRRRHQKRKHHNLLEIHSITPVVFRMRKFILLILLSCAAPLSGQTRADTLRGTWTTPGRAWWDVTFYDLHVAIQPRDTTIKGWNRIVYKVLQPSNEMQIDLMEPLVV